MVKKDGYEPILFDVSYGLCFQISTFCGFVGRIIQDCAKHKPACCVLSESSTYHINPNKHPGGIAFCGRGHYLEPQL